MLVAVAAAIGNLLQGWDNATIAGNFLLDASVCLLHCQTVNCFILAEHLSLANTLVRHGHFYAHK